MRSSKRKWLTVILTAYFLIQLGIYILEFDFFSGCNTIEDWSTLLKFFFHIFHLGFFTLAVLYAGEVFYSWKEFETEEKKRAVLLVVVILIFAFSLYHKHILNAKILAGVVVAWGVIKFFHYFYYDSVGSEPGEKRQAVKAGELEYRKDAVYIPKLLEKIECRELEERTSHMLYTFMVGAKKYKRRYHILTTLSVFFPAAITVFTNLKLENNLYIQVLVSLCSMAMAVLTGISGSVKAKESWIRYRMYCERVKKELVCYQLKIQPYTSTGSEERLAQELEKIYEDERQEWDRMRGRM